MCDERERLIGYLYDECDPAERRAVDAHLEQCPECRAEVQALRQVRSDLLAWEVPGQPQVWRFPVPAEQPWWRQVPAWAMSAAAGLVLAAGFAGGVAARALDGPTADAVMVAAPPLAPTTGVTQADLSEAQQRILALMRAELDRQAARVTDLRQNVRYASRVAGDPALQQVNALTRESDDMFETLASLYDQSELHRSQTEQRIRTLENQIALLDLALRNTIAGGGAAQR